MHKILNPTERKNQRICKFCNIQFGANDKRKIFCSKDCRSSHIKKFGGTSKGKTASKETKLKLKLSHLGQKRVLVW